MRALLKTVLAQNSLPTLLKITTGCCVLIFILLELWRPRYFLSDDNLSGGYPFLSEMGHRLQHGQSPLVSDYLFGGNYDWSRDLGCLYWHPFYLLPALLAGTWAQTWMMEVIAFPHLLLTTIGFTILAHKLREDYKLTLCDGWLIFYTMSFVFSMYILMIGPSWLSFLGNQCALPWLTLGILDKKLYRGVLIVMVVTLNQFVSSYAGMTFSNTLFLTLFALGITVCQRNPRAVFIWATGNGFAYTLLAPFLIHVLEGFFQSMRLHGLTYEMATAFPVPAAVFPYSFFLGNWTEPLAKLSGDSTLSTLSFPFVFSLLPCAAAWCLVPALFSPVKWRPIEVLYLALAGLVAILIIRPDAINQVVQHIPLLKALRWPFREILQFLFFIHLFLILRPTVPNVAVRRLVVTYSVAMFFLPLPFIRVPTLNPFTLDRRIVLSGDGDRFWDQVRPLLKPTDRIATVIDWKVWREHNGEIPYTYLGTANYPALYRVPCISGYSTTTPRDQLPLKTLPFYWFGAFNPSQVDAILGERPDLKLIVLDSVSPLKITLRTQGQPDIDLTPYIPH